MSPKPRKRGTVAIPWVTALYVFKKVLPVVIDTAPELLKTLERRRTAAAPSASIETEPSFAMMQERLQAQEQLLTGQGEVIAQLEATLRATRRSLALAWVVLAAAVLGATIALVALLRA